MYSIPRFNTFDVYNDLKKLLPTTYVGEIMFSSVCVILSTVTGGGGEGDTVQPVWGEDRVP